jgi:protein arginine kinase
MERLRTPLEDKVYRAEALLRSARVISSSETMYLLSLVRLGLSLNILRDLDLTSVNELLLLTQPAHLQRILNREMAPDDRGIARAEYIRKRIGAARP